MVHILLLFSIVIAYQSKRGKLFVGAAFSWLFAFAALRYMFGNDYASYLNNYKMVHDLGIDVFGREILFTALNKAIPSFYALIALTSAVFCYTAFRLVKTNVPVGLAWLSVAIFVVNPTLFLINLSSIRQCMAMCLFILAVECIDSKRPIIYVVLILCASLFHTTAILLLPIYWFANDKPVTWKWVIMVSCSVLIFLASGDLLNNIVTSGLSWFDNKNYIAYYSQQIRNSLRATILSSIPLIYLLINLPYLKGRALKYSKLWLLSTVFNVLAFRISMLTRIEMYFGIWSIVAYPLVFLSQKEVRKQRAAAINVVSNICFVLYSVVLLLRYYSFFTNPLWTTFTQYRTIFDLL